MLLRLTQRATITLTTGYGTLVIEASLVISLIAALISTAAFGLRVWDRRPRLQVAADCATWYYPDTDEEMGGAPGGELLWIDIVNDSSKRVMVSEVILRWKPNHPTRTWIHFNDILMVANYKATWEDFHRFWVDPWGAESRNLDCEELKSRLKKRTRQKRAWVSVLVKDVLGREAKSKVISLNL